MVSLTIYPFFGWLAYWAKFPFGHIYTNLIFTWNLSLTSISSLTIIMLAVVKYIKLSRPTTFDNIITMTRLRMIIIASWVIPLLTMSPYLIIPQSYRISTISFSITVATLVSLPVFYFLILYVYKKSRKRVSRMTASTTQRNFNQRSTIRGTRKVVRRSLWLIGVYFLCSVLTILSRTLYSTGVVDSQSGVWFQMSTLVFLGNSCCNPCIYMFMDSKIWKISKQLFTKRAE